MSNSNCYKTEDCKESYCVEQTSVCYKTDDCNYGYCVDPNTKEHGKAQTDEVVQETGKYMLFC
jgi:hypothetical protein